MQHVADVPNVVLPGGAMDNDVIQVHCSVVGATKQQLIHHALERSGGSVKPKWYYPKLEEPVGDRGGLGSRFFLHGDLPVPTGKVQGCYVLGLAKCVDHVVYAGHRHQHQR